MSADTAPKSVQKQKKQTIQKKETGVSHEDSAWKCAYERWKKDPQKWNMSILEIAEAGGAKPNTLAYIKLDQAS